jgi:hypothetical protein
MSLRSATDYRKNQQASIAALSVWLVASVLLVLFWRSGRRERGSGGRWLLSLAYLSSV